MYVKNKQVSGMTALKYSIHTRETWLCHVTMASIPLYNCVTRNVSFKLAEVIPEIAYF